MEDSWRSERTVPGQCPGFAGGADDDNMWASAGWMVLESMIHSLMPAYNTS